MQPLYADTTLPAWKLATRVPPSKYSQQREKALGGPFDRSSSTSIPKPAKGKGKSAAQPYTGSSSKAAQDMQRLAAVLGSPVSIYHPKPS